ncbi:MAG: inositol monophosphatase [Armatimonadota bacterium]|nr:inositol monophosphatase [bacterium]MDW8321853.1 inositol monophosphatase [Armatimonadota bacterium]
MLIEEVKNCVVEAGKLAQQLADGFTLETKSDDSFVTNADRAVESYLREHLARLVPEAGFFGEEEGFTNQHARLLWAIDPIDGTSNYVFGIPLWGVSVALVKDERIQLGVIFLPVLSELYWAETGNGAYLNGKRITAVDSEQFTSEDIICYASDAVTAELLGKMPGRPRCFGSAVVKLAWTAAGRVRGALSLGRLYDLAAGLLLCREAGCETRYLSGAEWRPQHLLSGAALHEPVLTAPPLTMQAIFRLLHRV